MIYCIFCPLFSPYSRLFGIEGHYFNVKKFLLRIWHALHKFQSLSMAYCTEYTVPAKPTRNIDSTKTKPTRGRLLPNVQSFLQVGSSCHSFLIYYFFQLNQSFNQSKIGLLSLFSCSFRKGLEAIWG